jgi:hypothetical protein
MGFGRCLNVLRSKWVSREVDLGQNTLPGHVIGCRQGPVQLSRSESSGTPRDYDHVARGVLTPWQTDKNLAGVGRGNPVRDSRNGMISPTSPRGSGEGQGRAMGREKSGQPL